MRISIFHFLLGFSVLPFTLKKSFAIAISDLDLSVTQTQRVCDLLEIWISGPTGIPIFDCDVLQPMESTDI